ncbi:MAG: XkdF-like putative serine protease domain-containing protein [Halovenus sp.]
MPPVTKAGGEQFRKDVTFAATEKDEDDDYELRASGIVMVPDKVDLQQDFAREETIRGFADQFETFVEAGQAGGGVMHAVFPDGWMTLERNEVLDESEEIGGQTVDAGAWVQEWGVSNADLAELIDDGILEGYSIGAIQVGWDGPFETDELDNVEVPDELGDNPLIWELTDGIIREVSAVDIPAVPDAQILEAKTLDKRLADHLGNRDAFIAEAQERGHSEADAEQLWDVLNEAVETEGSAEPGKQSVFAKAGKAFLSALTGADDDGTSKTSEDPDPAAKEGRTLSTANRDDLKASIDAAVSILEDAGVDHGITRFTDREDDSFDLSEHQARSWPKPDDEDSEDGESTDVSPMNDPAGDDTPDDDTMTDDTNDDGEDGKSLAERNAEQINELTNAVTDLTESISGPQPKTAEIEIDGETYEVREDAAKAALGIDDGTDVGEAIARLNEKAERVDEVEQRLNTVSRQSGRSMQLEASHDDDTDDGEGGLDGIGKALS